MPPKPKEKARIPSPRSQYSGMQTGAKYVTIGPLIPTATNEEYHSWKRCLQERGFIEEDINKAGYGTAASACQNGCK